MNIGRKIKKEELNIKWILRKSQNVSIRGWHKY